MAARTIIEVALNGGLTKRRNPRVPRTPSEVSADAMACISAGAAIVHSHTDDPVLSGSGEHAAAPYIEAWAPVLRRHPEVLFYPTMPGGREDVPVERRYAHVSALHEAGVLGLGLVDPGSTNFGRTGRDHLPVSERRVYINSYEDAVYMTESCRRMQVGISISIFEPGFLRFVLAYHQANQLPAGTLIKLYFGGDNVLFGFPGQPLAQSRPGLEAYLAMLEDTELPWMVSIQGGDVVASGLAGEAIRRGGHLQVGLEPSADPTRSNQELVARAAALADSLGRPCASPAETRKLLRLPG